MNRRIAGLMIFLAVFASEVVAGELMSGTIDISTVEGLMQFHKLPFRGDVTETGIELYPYKVGKHYKYDEYRHLTAEEPYQQFFVFSVNDDVVRYLELPGSGIARTIEYGGELYGITSPSMMTGARFIYDNYVVNLSKGKVVGKSTSMGAAEFVVVSGELYIAVYQLWSAAAMSSMSETPTVFYRLDGTNIGNVLGSYSIEGDEVVTRRSFGGTEKYVTRLNLRSGKETEGYEPNS